MWQLSPRAAQILAALVAEYIDSAEPVGSARLARAAGLGVSSATVRNTLAELEELGYLQQPHTSAGRIPSDRGYRFYVDQLLAAPRPLRGGAAMEAQLRRDAGTPALAEDVLAAVSQVLSRASRLVAFALPMTAGDGILKEIEFVPLSSTKVLVVVVADGGQVSRKAIDVGEEHRAAGPSAGVELPQHRICRHAAREHPRWRSWSACGTSARCAMPCVRGR